MSFITEPLVMVRIRQPLCSRTFGVAPCNAVGEKCFNTDFTCKFRTALSMTAELVQDFVMADEAHEWVDVPGAYQPGLAIPALLAAPTSSPTELNVADGDDDKASIGVRLVVQVMLKDFAHNDYLVDPYAATRSYDALSQGTYWAKWLKRNPYHQGDVMETYEGVRGDALAAMTKRVVYITKIDRTADQVKVTAKDILAKISDTNITYPPLSPGTLNLAMGVGDTSFAVINADAATDYPATSGLVRIGTEVIAYVARSGTGTVTFTGCTRAQIGTVAATHAQNDRVQRVVAYVDQRPDAILYDVLVNGGKTPVANVPLATWNAEIDQWRPEYLFTAYLTEPVLVTQLAGEVCASALTHIWTDERTGLVRLEAQRPIAAPITLTWENDIVQGSYRETEHPQQRASSFVVYYRPRSWINGIGDSTNYESGRQYIDSLSEVQYGSSSLRQLFSRWIKSDALAITLAATYVGRFRDVRRKISFQLRAADVWTGDQVRIRHYADVDIFGAPEVSLWLITKAEVIVPGAKYAFEAEDNDMVGVLWEWVDDTIPDWASATPLQKATIGYWLTDDDRDIDGNLQPFRWL